MTEGKEIKVIWKLYKSQTLRIKCNCFRYYQVLEMANEGDVRPFIRFIAESTEQTLDLFLWATTEYATEVPAIDSAARTIIVEE